jgi:FkbM family methyltransferase
MDVGANVGLFALVASDWGRRPLRGVAVEPAPPVAEALQANLQAHGLMARGAAAATSWGVAVCAVGAAPGRLVLHHYPRATMLSTAHPQALQSVATRQQVADSLHLLPPRWRGLARAPRWLRRAAVALALRGVLRAQRHDCEVRTVSQLWREHGLERLDLLKIDAEQAEWDVLLGIEALHWPLIRQVVMEVHDQAGRLAQVLDLLAAQGLSQIVTEQAPDLACFGVWQVWARRP